MGTMRAIVGLVALAAIACGMASRWAPESDARARTAALAFLDLLSPEQRSACVLPLDAAVRLDWHFVPRDRPGLSMSAMTEPQRAAARALLRTTLSSRGMLKAESIMDLDAVLRDMERAAGRDGGVRDPLRYTIAIYGLSESAGATAQPFRAWGWKIEGHHISLNFTWPREDLLAPTPAFLGASPAEVRRGAKAGLRVLAAEEDLARSLLESLDALQRRQAVIADDAPRDILALPGRSLDEAPPAGIGWAALRPEQRTLLEALIDEYVGNLSPESAAAQWRRIRDADMNSIRFAWAGSAERGRGHYYRIAGPTFVIEYDNTQEGANHVHTVWHDRERNFGADLLREHLERHHPRPTPGTTTPGTTTPASPQP